MTMTGTGYLKTFELSLLEMAQSLLADLGIQVDLVPGSGIELSILEAVAMQVNDLSERGELSIMEAIPAAIYQAFNFAAMPPQFSKGTLGLGVQVPNQHPVLIPAGTEASDDEQVFRTVEDATLPAGELKVTVAAQSVEGGRAANVPAFTVNRLITGVPGISLVTNPTPFTGGTDAETPEEQLQRFLDHLDALDRSNLLALAIGARAATADNMTVRNVLVMDGNQDPSIPPGRFQVHAYRAGGVPAALLEALKVEVHRRRSGGCIPSFTVTPGTPVDVQARLTVSSVGAVPDARAALGAYFDNLKYGQKVSRENLIATLKNAHVNVLEADVTSPAADIPAGMYQRFELGTVTITESDVEVIQ